MATPHSDACFVRACPAAIAEAWGAGHIHAFVFFGRVPVSVLYDNDRCLVAKILPDGLRQRATLFSGYLSHYLFRDRYGRRHAESVPLARPRAMTKTMWKGWSAISTATSWCRSRGSRAGRPSMPTRKSSVSRVRRMSCGVSLRP